MILDYIRPRLDIFQQQKEATLHGDEKALQLASALAILNILVQYDLLKDCDHTVTNPLCYALLLKPSNTTSIESYQQLKDHYDPEMLK